MKLVIDNADVLKHVKQLPLPPMVKIGAVSFQPGGSIIVTGSALFGFSLKLQVKVMAPQLVRLRVVEAKYVGVGLVDLLFAAANQLALPGLTCVTQANDKYFEYRLPIDYLAISDIATDGVLTVTGAVDIPKLQAFLAAAQKAKLENSGSMADQARLAKAGQ